MRDMAERGRAAKGERNHFGRVRYAGEKNWNAKMNPEAVRAIRASSEPYATLMARYGVSSGCIAHIKSRRSWAHVT